MTKVSRSWLWLCVFLLCGMGCSESAFRGVNTKNPGTPKTDGSLDSKGNDNLSGADGVDESDPDAELDFKDDEQVEADNDELSFKDNNVLAPIDTACSDGVPVGRKIEISPPTPNLPKTVPEACRTGIEFNRLKRSSFTLESVTTLAKTIPIEVDIATYTAEDRIRIFASTDHGDKLVLDSCRMRTSTYGDPSGGNKRPSEDSIRSFRLKLPKNVESLRFDFSNATTPTYMRLIGLCDFSTTPTAIDGKNPDLRSTSD